MIMISILKSRQGKIPRNMFADYNIVAAESEQAGLCSVQVVVVVYRLFIIIGNGEEVQLEVIDQVVHSVSREHANIQECLETLKSVLPLAKTVQREYDLKAPALVLWQIKVVDKIFCTICQELTDDLKASKWVPIVLELLSHVRSIVWPLMVRLRDLLTKQVSGICLINTTNYLHYFRLVLCLVCN